MSFNALSGTYSFALSAEQSQAMQRFQCPLGHIFLRGSFQKVTLTETFQCPLGHIFLPQKRPIYHYFIYTFLLFYIKYFSPHALYYHSLIFFTSISHLFRCESPDVFSITSDSHLTKYIISRLTFHKFIIRHPPPANLYKHPAGN